MQERILKWRQGSVLNEISAKHLGLIDESQVNLLPVIITHDCDLQHTKEEIVELIIGEKIENLESNYTKAKNPRRLHLDFISDGKNYIYLNLEFSNKKNVSKEDLLNLRQKESIFEISPKSKQALKQWLAARYGRPAFPNLFEKYLRESSGNRTVESQLAKILEPFETYIVGIFFDLGKHKSIDLKENEPYKLRIAVVYDSTTNGIDARTASEEVVQRIDSLFAEVYGKYENATKIELESCSAISDQQFTLSDIRNMDQWRLEYLSIGHESSGIFIQSGNN